MRETGPAAGQKCPVLAGAVGGADAVRYLAPVLSRLPIPGISEVAEPLSFAVVVVTITYLTLVIGELVPKRLALEHPENMSRAMARPMRHLAAITRPVVWVLSRSTDAVLRPLGVSGAHRPSVTEEEVRYLVAEGARTGVFVPAERKFVERIFRFADQTVGDVMRPRPDVVALDIDEPWESLREEMIASGYSRFPVYREDLSRILGVVHAKDLLSQGEAQDLKPILREALFVPETKSLLGMLQTFQETHSQMAIVINEFGGTRWNPNLAQFMDDQMSLFEERGLNYAFWEWPSSWEPFVSDVNAFNFLFGPDPDNNQPVETSELIEVVRKYWGLNTARP